MTIWQRIKSWWSGPPVRTTTLPNGRVAVVDERGNFVRFKARD